MASSQEHRLCRVHRALRLRPCCLKKSAEPQPSPAACAFQHVTASNALDGLGIGCLDMQPRPFGSTGLPTSPLGLGSSYGLGATGVERAFDRGVRFFLWGSRRRDGFGEGLRQLGRSHRDEMTIAIQSYTRVASLMEWSVDRALRALGTDYVDVLCLAWWNGEPPQRIIDAAMALRDKQKVKKLMVSCHHRPTFARFIDDPSFDALMLRYSAAHRGAEREVFPLLARRRPGVVAFTATRWGSLLDPQRIPAGEAVPRASDCYRFALTNPNVDVCLAGPKNDAELDEALLALERGPLDPEEDAWMRRVGNAVRDAASKPRAPSVLDVVDRLATFRLCTPRQLPSA
jgi:aryl-alcohol dehydrogenase-like predicted oxidoreductase